MTSLSEVYTPDAEFQTSLRRLYAGLGLFAAGVLLAIAGVVVGTTGLLGSLTASWEWAGVLAGVGVPAVFLGIFALLPSGKQTRAAAVIGAALALLGVALFVHAYPCQWIGSNCANGRPLLTLPVALLYSAGAATTLWCLFTGIANFKARNNPGGTAHVEVTAQGETRVIEVPKAELSKFSGSMGVLGDPTEDVEGPDRPGARSGDGDDGSTVYRNTGGSVASDGGASSNTITDVGDDVLVQGGSADEADSEPSGPNGPTGTTSTGGPSSPGSKPTRRDADDSTGSRPNRASGSVDTVESTHTRDKPTGTAGGSSGRSPRRDEDWEPSGTGPATEQTSGPDRDSYCGSCKHFEYVQTDQGMQPYCHAHSEVMDDMEACDDYAGRHE